MPNNFDLILEAERRGILSEEKKALLNEARRRGLVGAPKMDAADQNAPLGETKKEESGGPLTIEAPSLLSIEFPQALAANVAGGLRNLAVGTAGLGAEASEKLLGSAIDKTETGRAAVDAITSGINRLGLGDAVIKAGETLGLDRPFSKALNDIVPRIKPAGTGGEIIQSVAQYAPLATKAALATGSRLAQVPALSKAAESIFGRLLQKGTTLGAQTAAAGLADAAATIPSEAATLGDIFNFGPTAISPEDTPLERRLKVGAETGIAEPIVRTGAALRRAGAGVASGATEAFNRVFRPGESAVKEDVARYLQQEASDVAKAVKGIEESTLRNAGTEFKPTAGKASKDPGLMAIEQSLATEGPVRDRLLANRNVIAEDIKAFSEPRVPVENVDKIRALAETEKQTKIAPLEAKKQTLSQDLDKIQQDMKDFTFDLSKKSQQVTSASEDIDAAFRDIDARLTKTKSELFDAIDPEGTVMAPAEDLVDQLMSVKQLPLEAKSEFPAEIISDTLAEIEKNGGAISFRELDTLRKRISGDLAQAKAENKGSLAQKLQNIKTLVNKKISAFAEQLGPEQADAMSRYQKAMDFFTEEYAPRLKMGAGGQLRTKMKRGEVPASATGRAFLKPGTATGAKESAESLNRLISAAEKPEEMAKSARDFLIGRMAGDVGSPTGLKGKELDRWVSRFDRFKQDYADALGENPEILREINQMRNRAKSGSQKIMSIEQELEDTASALGRSEKEFNLSATGRYLQDTLEQGRTPEMAIDSAVRSNDIRRVKELFSLTKKDRSGAATAGLQDLVRSSIARKLVSDIPTPTGEALSASAAKIGRFFDGEQGKKNWAMIELVFGETPGDIAALRRFRNQIREVSRYSKGTPGSDTAALLAQKNKNSILVDLAGSLEGLSGRSRAQSRLNIVDTLLGRFGRDRETIRNRILTDAILNPELAKTLLMLPTKKNIKDASKRIHTFYANNFPDLFENEKEANNPRRD